MAAHLPWHQYQHSWDRKKRKCPTNHPQITDGLLPGGTLSHFLVHLHRRINHGTRISMYRPPRIYHLGLPHKTSSTMAELHGILQALIHIHKHDSLSWVVCTGSKSALQTVASQDSKRPLVYNILKTHTNRRKQSKSITLQLLKYHSMSS